MKKLLACVVTSCVAALLPVDAGAETPPTPLPLDWCLERAAEANPRIAIDRETHLAATQRIDPAGALDDPRFGYQASNVPVGDLDFTSTPLSGHQLGLRQKLPFPGVLGNRREAARAGADAAELSLEDRQLLTASAVESAWAELGFAQRALGITDRNIDLVRQLTRVAEAKYRVGTGLQQDVIRAQVQLTTLLDERLHREARVASAGARLVALLDLSPELDLPETAALDDPSPLPTLAGLLAALDEASPRLRARSSRVEQAKRLVRVAKLEGYPDFDLGIGYRIRQQVAGDAVDGDDFLSAGVTVRLPVDRSKWRARVAERQSMLRREEARYRAERARLAAELRSSYANLVRADSEVTLVRTGLVPQAEQSLEASRSGYQVGRIDFLSLLDSQVRLLDAELRGVRATADRRVAFSALEAAAGERLR
jgi:outer membrane protein TolC